jgi:hypothetical protein
MLQGRGETVRKTLVWCALAAVVVTAGEWLLNVSPGPDDCLLQNCGPWVLAMGGLPLVVTIVLAVLWGRMRMPTPSSVALAVAAILPLSIGVLLWGGDAGPPAAIFFLGFGTPVLVAAALFTSGAVARVPPRREPGVKDEDGGLPPPPSRAS